MLGFIAYLSLIFYIFFLVATPLPPRSSIMSSKRRIFDSDITPAKKMRPTHGIISIFFYSFLAWWPAISLYSSYFFLVLDLRLYSHCLVLFVSQIPRLNHHHLILALIIHQRAYLMLLPEIKFLQFSLCYLLYNKLAELLILNNHLAGFLKHHLSMLVDILLRALY